MRTFSSLKINVGALASLERISRTAVKGSPLMQAFWIAADATSWNFVIDMVAGLAPDPPPWLEAEEDPSSFTTLSMSIQPTWRGFLLSPGTCCPLSCLKQRNALILDTSCFARQPSPVEAVEKRVCRGWRADLNSHVAECARLSRHS